ncbi:MAG TPA: fluoride efflux transporter CrcB [Kineosporiaceae bacterium]|nr:fluoride efflux transporter CrcB [Kineosporiaceae bacterium]
MTGLGAALLVVAGATVGAPLRYVTDLAVQSVHDTVFPWGTLIVNVVGSLILGVVAGAVAGGAPSWLLTLIGTGLCGALTTFSTFGFETVRLIEDGALFEAAMNSLVSLLAGLVACMGGFALAAAIA